jgi:hypothetical protein
MAFTLRGLESQELDVPRLLVTRVASLDAYKAHVVLSETVHHDRWIQELALCKTEQAFSTPGWFYACREKVEFKTDFQYATTPLATSNSPTYGRPNSPGQDALIIS